MKLKQLIQTYRKGINPPYSKKDFPIVAGTLLVLLIVTLVVVILPNQYKSKQTENTHAQEVKKIEVQAAPDEILVKFKPGATERIKNSVRRAFGLTKKDELTQIGVEVLKTTPVNRDHIAEALNKRPEVQFAQLNFITKPAIVPNDTNYSTQWHLPDISADRAWDVAKATGILIGMCDTGVNQVPDLAPVLRTDLGWNAVDGSSNFSDPIGHGTGTAGAAAAATNNALGVAGVAWGAQIIPVRVSNLSDGSAYTSDIAKCINYSADHGAKAINASYGVAGDSTINSAGLYAQSKGALLTISAGNSGLDPGWSNLPGIIAVSAMDTLNNPATFTNFGNFIDVAAPGASIYTTKNDGNYWYTAGTSFSAPIAAGVIGLIFGAKPSLTAAQAQDILFKNSDDLGISGWDKYFGWGRVNALRTVDAALGLAPDTTAPIVSITNPITNSTVSGQSVSISTQASDNFGVTKEELYIDNALIGTTTWFFSGGTASFTWDSRTVPNGSHTIIAKAYDGADNAGTSTSVIINVVNSSDITDPTISITSPANNTTVSGTINVAAIASDNIGVVKVTFDKFGAPLQTFTNPPYSFSWDTNAALASQCPTTCITNIQATAYDAAGNYASANVGITYNNSGVTTSPTATPTIGLSPTNTPIPSPTPSLTDHTSPTVTISSPLAGSTVAVRSNVNIQATASDNIGVARTEFYVNGTLTCSDTSSPYSCSWKVPGAKNKSYSISAKTYDAAGNNSTSSISVTAK